MLRFQPHLPNLPVPPLKKTLDLYLSSIQPHLSPAEFASSSKVVSAFGGSDLAGKLQERLEKRAQGEGRDSWLSEWWNDVAYMGYRSALPRPFLSPSLCSELTWRACCSDPVVPYVNYFYVHKGTGGEGKTQTRRAAELILATEAFRGMVERSVRPAFFSFRSESERRLPRDRVADAFPAPSLLSSSSQTLEPERVRVTPLCMDSYKNLLVSSP